MHPNHIESVWPKHGQIEIPRSPYPRAEEPLQWAHKRERQQYEDGIARGLTNQYGPNDITYKYNRHGYRCMELDNLPKGFRVLSLGCSNTEGVGVPFDHTWPEIFCKTFSQNYGSPVLNLNLGVGGSSNHSIARRAGLAIPALKPDLVVVAWSYAHRILYTFPNGESVDWVVPNERDLTLKDPETRLKILYYQKIQNDGLDMNALMTNIMLVNAVAELNKVKLIHVFSYLSQYNRNFLLERQTGVIETIPIRGEARDFSHPGVQFNSWIASATFNHYQKTFTD